MTPWLQDADVTLYHGDVLQVLRELPAESVDCCVTSPPYWGLRDYGTGAWDGGDEGCDHQRQSEASRQSSTLVGSTDTQGGTYAWGATCGKCGATRIDQQLGLEPTPEEYVTRMVEVFREVRRVLAAHGTVWLNLGDSYAAQRGEVRTVANRTEAGSGMDGKFRFSERSNATQTAPASSPPPGLKPKDLVGIPWRVAFALQADGWYLRSDIIWAKPNPMPESVTDRPTKAHEYVFLLSKQPRYFFDQEAVREAYAPSDPGNGGNRSSFRGGYDGMHDKKSDPVNDGTSNVGRAAGPDGRRKTTVQGADGSIQHRDGERWPNGGRNIRSVWEIATQPYPEAHFATFPEELARRCIAAGCPESVCRVCGKAREPLLERTGVVLREPAVPIRERRGDAVNDKRTALSGTQVEAATMRRIGLSDCGHDDYRPGVTLDPFIGSGTVAHVARKLGRHAVGIDLSEEYLKLAARRLQQQSLFAEASA